MTDSSGTIHARYDYDAWGRATKLSGDQDSDFGYSGMYVNKTTGLDLTWFRAYDPEKGRWLSRDPLEGMGVGAAFYQNANGKINLYGYVSDDPFNRVDPFGLCDCNCGCNNPKFTPGQYLGLEVGLGTVGEVALECCELGSPPGQIFFAATMGMAVLHYCKQQTYYPQYGPPYVPNNQADLSNPNHDSESNNGSTDNT